MSDMSEGDYIPAVNMDKAINMNPMPVDEEQLLNVTQHFRAKIIEKAMKDQLNDVKYVGLALMAASGIDKQTMDKRKLTIAQKAVDNEAEALAFIGSVHDRIGSNPFAVNSVVNVDSIINEDNGKLPDIVINKGALDVGTADLNYEKFMQENNVNLDELKRDQEDNE